MRHVFTARFALAILGGAYVLNFGVPAQVAQIVPFLAPTQDDANADTRRNGQQAPGGRTPSVLLQPLEYRPYPATIQTVGSAKSWRSTNIVTETSGRITAVALTPNKRVEADLALTQAMTNVARAKVTLDRRTIRAPFAGKLGLDDIEVGNLLDASDAIVAIDDTDTLLVEFEIPERSISMLELGRTVLASTPS